MVILEEKGIAHRDLKPRNFLKNYTDKIIPDNPLLEDTFAFGLSLLEMGNLLSLKNIRLNKEKELL